MASAVEALITLCIVLASVFCGKGTLFTVISSPNLRWVVSLVSLTCKRKYVKYIFLYPCQALLCGEHLVVWVTDFLLHRRVRLTLRMKMLEGGSSFLLHLRILGSWSHLADTSTLIESERISGKMLKLIRAGMELRKQNCESRLADFIKMYSFFSFYFYSYFLFCCLFLSSLLVCCD